MKNARHIFWVCLLGIIYGVMIHLIFYSLDQASWVSKDFNADFLHGFVSDFKNILPHVRWDSIWYYALSRDGYWGNLPSSPFTAGFYPLYPAIIRLVHEFLGIDLFLSGLCVSLLFFLLFLLILDRSLREVWHFSKHVSLMTLVVFMLLPMSFICVTNYHVSLFLFLAVATIYFFKKGNLRRAYGFAFLLGLTHMHAISLAAGFCAVGLLQRSRASSIAAFAILSGTFLLMIHHYYYFGDALFYIKAKAHFDSEMQRPWQWISEFLTAILNFIETPFIGYFIQIINSLTLTAAIVMGLVIFVRKRREYLFEWTSIAALCAIQLSVGTAWGFSRFSLFLFPLVVVPLKSWIPSKTLLLLALVSASIQAVEVLHWIQWQAPSP